MTAAPVVGVDIYRWREEIIADGDLLPAARLVAVRISMHVNKNSGLAWPSQETLSRECAMARSSVQRHLDAAIERGWIGTTAPPRRGRTTRYKLTHPSVIAADLTDDAAAVPNDSRVGHELTHYRVTERLTHRSQNKQGTSHSEDLLIPTAGDASASAGATAPAPPPAPRPIVDLERLFSHEDWSASSRPGSAELLPVSQAERQPSCAECGGPASEDVALVMHGVRRHAWCLPATVNG